MAPQLNKKLLLKGGTLLIHDESNHVVPTRSDILVQGNLISRIQTDILPDLDTHVIDIQGKIVSPGFIDTHRHLYQTQLKGRHANHSLIEYMPRGNFVAALYSSQDLFWGELAGAMESIDAGTTTVVDHSSCNITSEYRKSQIASKA
jgi:cytosine/adenosine deaminase-related metal-dependent hydrolase